MSDPVDLIGTQLFQEEAHSPYHDFCRLTHLRYQPNCVAHGLRVAKGLEPEGRFSQTPFSKRTGSAEQGDRPMSCQSTSSHFRLAVKTHSSYSTYITVRYTM